LCVALSLYWQLRGRVNDGRAWLDEALQVDTSDRRLRATMLSRAGVLAWRQSDYARAQQLLEDSLAIERELGDASSIARRLRSLSLVSMSAGEGRTAARLAEESLGIFREHNDQPGVLWALVFLGWARYACGEMSEGAEHLRQAVAAGRAVGAGAMTANALLGLAYRAAHAEDVAAHRAFLADALTEVRRVGGDTEEVTWLWIAAGLAANEGRFESALRLAGAADAWSRRHGGETAERFMISLEPLLERAGQAVGSDTADRLRAEGARMTWEELATAALAEPRRDAEEPLSRREREVVELVAGGMTNVEIAERLFISKRTVESHIDHIKQKLGFRSRSQVMAWALRESVGADRGVAGADPEGS
jgi:DNA-binding CsgD family transcriptional regulator